MVACVMAGSYGKDDRDVSLESGLPMTATEWEHSSKDGLTEANITFTGGDGENLSVVLHEAAHIIHRSVWGPDDECHGQRYSAIEGKLLDAFKPGRSR